MLFSFYCACGELSLFSSKLAALNAQAQQHTGENVSGATTNAQGRLLIFDSTFLLMTRIQHVFADMVNCSMIFLNLFNIKIYI